jgi:hypothetical protein
MKTNVIYLSDCRPHGEQLCRAKARRSVIDDNTFSMITTWSRLDASERARLLDFAQIMAERRDDLKV